MNPSMNEKALEELSNLLGLLHTAKNAIEDVERLKQTCAEDVQVLESRNQELQTKLDFTVATFQHTQLLITHLCLWHGEHSKHISVEGNRKFLKLLGVPEEGADKYTVGVEKYED